MPRYNPAVIEPKWQKFWEENRTFKAPRLPKGKKLYVLDMFPYPSGDGLHVGHPEGYTATDIVCRYRRMRGFSVMHPMGWDAFGLPAENEAINKQSHPRRTVPEYIATYKRQMDLIGIGYDWSREINSSEPDYYKWTQWIFLKLYEAGLAYTGKATVNWCPSCQTVLANEELDGDTCERCGSLVNPEQVGNQWFFRITDYSDRLLDDIERLDNWPERVRAMQANWIGRSHGVSFRFEVEGDFEDLEVFTTRIDTLYGVTYVVLAPEHPMVAALTAGTEREEPVREFARSAMREGEVARAATDTKKRGIFTGAYAIHPLTGERVPIWVGNYVLMGYGSGAIMAVPAHDQRDLELAREYGLPVRVVIQPAEGGLDGDTLEAAYTGEGRMVNSGPFDGM